jgi:SsrA-binding protein
MTTAPDQFKKISDNRKAFFDYAIEERVEAGIVLTGTEIKAIRSGQVNLRDAYARIQNGEMWLYNMHIAQWRGGGPWNHEPLRARKLLLHKTELARLGLKAGQQGLTIVPLRLYIKHHRAKIEVALAKGKRKYDKRQTIIRRETDREMQRAIRLRQ